MGIDLSYVIHPTGAGEQVVMDLQHDFRIYLQFAFHEHVEGMGYHPLGGVLHRNHPVLGSPFLHLLENRRYRLLGNQFGGQAELLQGRLVGERRLGAEERHLHGGFQCQ